MLDLANSEHLLNFGESNCSIEGSVVKPTKGIAPLCLEFKTKKSKLNKIN